MARERETSVFTVTRRYAQRFERLPRRCAAHAAMMPRRDANPIILCRAMMFIFTFLQHDANDYRSHHTSDYHGLSIAADDTIHR